MAPLASGDEIRLPDNPQFTVSLLMLAAEFADDATTARLWDAADEVMEPTWNDGEFTFGFGLGEPHPRGQFNARAMAAWTCDTGAWSRIFEEPNLTKFDQPTIVDVDFPAFALSEATWDGHALTVRVEPQRAAARPTTTRFAVTNVGEPDGWFVRRDNAQPIQLPVEAGRIVVDAIADGTQLRISR